MNAYALCFLMSLSHRKQGDMHRFVEMNYQLVKKKKNGHKLACKHLTFTWLSDKQCCMQRIAESISRLTKTFLILPLAELSSDSEGKTSRSTNCCGFKNCNTLSKGPSFSRKVHAQQARKDIQEHSIATGKNICSFLAQTGKEVI